MPRRTYRKRYGKRSVKRSSKRSRTKKTKYNRATKTKIRRGARATRNFVGKVHSALNAMEPYSTWIENDIGDLNIGSVDAQAFAIIGYKEVPNLKVAWDTTQTTGSSTNQKKFVLESASIDVTMYNRNQNTIILDMYEITPKKDLPQTFTYTDLWDQGLAQQTIAPFSNATSQSLGVKPFDSVTLGRFYKTKLVSSSMLLPGHCKMFNEVDAVSKVIDLNKLIDESGTLLAASRGVTKYFGFLIRGQPIRDAGGALGTSRGALTIQYNARYKMRRQAELSSGQSYTFVRSNDMGTPPSATNQNLIVENNPIAAVTSTLV
ncbi:MAG: putative capsid protein [Arizlama virus AZLM_839]|nr:MAG: putative capsid protein [Arizlama virus]